MNDCRWTRAALAGAVAWSLIGLADALGGAPWWLAAWRQLAQALVFAWVVWRGVRGVDGATGRVLRFPAMIAIGRISYGVYLVHAFAPLVLHAGLGAMGVHGVDAWPAALRALAPARHVAGVSAVGGSGGASPSMEGPPARGVIARSVANVFDGARSRRRAWNVERCWWPVWPR